MKKFIVILSMILIFPLGVSAGKNTPATADSNVGYNVTYNQCNNFQDNRINATGQGYAGYCMLATCATGEWAKQYFTSGDVVYCANGNKNYYSKVVKTGCNHYEGVCTPKSTPEYCTLLVMYDCDKNKDGTTYSGSTSNLDSNNYLKNLTVSKGTLNFNKNTLNYTITVPSGTTSLSVGALAESAKAKVNIANTENVNENKPITITVTAENGTTRVYKINVKFSSNNTPTPTPAKDTNNYLKSITLDHGEINFNRRTNDYTITLDRSITKLAITALPESNKASVSVSNNENLSEDNPIKIVVTSESGAVRTYTIKIKYEGKVLDNNNYLKEIKLSVGTIEFKKDVLDYNVNIPEGVKEIEVIAIPESNNANILVENSTNITDTKPIMITVTAEDGSVKIYNIHINFAKEEVKSLVSNITVEGYKLKFDSKTNDYVLKIKKNDTKLKINVELNNSEDEFEIKGNNDLKNKSKITINVKSKDNKEEIYTITVKKSTNMLLYVLLSIMVVMAIIFGFRLIKNLLPGRKDKDYDYE